MTSHADEQLDSPQRRGSDILVFTCAYGHRTFLAECVPAMRAVFGCWADWAVWLGDPSPQLAETAETLLNDPRHLGIQYLTTWADNRGQHHAMKEALELARWGGYKWLLRLDDDIRPKTRDFLRKMIERLELMKTTAGDVAYRIVAAPRLVGLQNPPKTIGACDLEVPFMVELMGLLGGGCRLHPVELLDAYEPPLYAPKGRGDPEAIADYVLQRSGFQVRFPDLRVVHRTAEIEAKDTSAEAHLRRMNRIWPYLSPEIVE